MSENKQNPVVATAKEVRRGDQGESIVLSTGVRARLAAVGASLIEDAASRVDYPPVPTFYNEDKGREEENPNDPAYLKACADIDRQRARAANEAMVMFGVDLVDPIDFDGAWIKRLKWLEKRGRIELSEFDMDDEMDLEFLYKRYIAVGARDIVMLGKAIGMGRADLETALASFQDNEA